MEMLLAIALLVLVVVVVLVAKRMRKPADEDDTVKRPLGPGEKRCPFCAEAIAEAAKVCPHCRRDVSLQTMT